MKDTFLYVPVAAVVMPSAMYFFLRILHWDIFLSAFLASGLAWLIFKLVHRCLLARAPSTAAPVPKESKNESDI